MTAPAEALRALLAARDPLAAARAGGPADTVVRVYRGPAPAGWLVDDGAEGDIAAHRAAHAAGRPSEAVVLYGRDRPDDAVAARLEALAGLAAATGLLRAVHPVPAEGAPERPGSWGVEDLTVVAACRAALPDGVEVIPDWRHLGPAACQVAVAFGATALWLPAGDGADVAHLAEAIGRTATEAERR